MTYEKPCIVDIFTFDEELAAILKEAGLKVEEDRSAAPHEDISFACCNVPIPNLPGCLGSYKCELRDSSDGRFVDPATLNYTTYDRLQEQK